MRSRSFGLRVSLTPASRSAHSKGVSCGYTSAVTIPVYHPARRRCYPFSMSNPAQMLQINRSQDVTPSNTTDLAISGGTGDGGTLLTRAVSCGVAGNIRYIDKDGNDSILKGAIAGILYPIRAKRIMSTNTTATGIQAHW